MARQLRKRGRTVIVLEVVEPTQPGGLNAAWLAAGRRIGPLRGGQRAPESYDNDHGSAGPPGWRRSSRSRSPSRLDLAGACPADRELLRVTVGLLRDTAALLSGRDADRTSARWCEPGPRRPRT